jgi:carbamoyl-phosphate synthase large subunit
VSLNVLITAGSRRVALVQAFQRALAATGGGAVFVTDINELSPAVYVASRAYRAPLSTDPAYLDVVADLCQREHVGLVVPTIDDELAVFARGRRRLERLGLRVAVSPIETTEICDDKWETCRRLTAHGVPAAETFLPGTLPDDPVFPLFIKPRVGRGGVGAFAVRDQRELEFFLSYVPNPVVQQYLHGPEFTIDVFCNFDGEPLSIVPRERVVIRAGVMDRGRTVRDHRLTELALACTRALRFAGAINIQCRIVDGTPVVFEINPRFSGGVPLTIAAGADFPRMLVDLARGARLRPSIGRFKDGLWMTSYEASMFLPAAAVGFSQPATLARIPEVA